MRSTAPILKIETSPCCIRPAYLIITSKSRSILLTIAHYLIKYLIMYLYFIRNELKSASMRKRTYVPQRKEVMMANSGNN